MEEKGGVAARGAKPASQISAEQKCLDQSICKNVREQAQHLLFDIPKFTFKKRPEYLLTSNWLWIKRDRSSIDFNRASEN